MIVDRLTKVAHFISVKNNYSTEKLIDLYVDNILRFHGAPKSILSDRGSHFVAKFWKSIHKAVGTTSEYNTAFHPYTDG